jgi:hypothetical protein
MGSSEKEALATYRLAERELLFPLKGKKNIRQLLAWQGDLMANVARISKPGEKGSLSLSLGG